MSISISFYSHFTIFPLKSHHKMALECSILDLYSPKEISRLLSNAMAASLPIRTLIFWKVTTLIGTSILPLYDDRYQTGHVRKGEWFAVRSKTMWSDPPLAPAA